VQSGVDYWPALEAIFAHGDDTLKLSCTRLVSESGDGALAEYLLPTRNVWT